MHGLTEAEFPACKTVKPESDSCCQFTIPGLMTIFVSSIVVRLDNCWCRLERY